MHGSLGEIVNIEIILVLIRNLNLTLKKNYSNKSMPYWYRTALAKLTCGVVQFRFETESYEQLDINDRLCPVCTKRIEDEMHLLIYCHLYNGFRQSLFEKAVNVLPN